MDPSGSVLCWCKQKLSQALGHLTEPLITQNTAMLLANTLDCFNR